MGQTKNIDYKKLEAKRPKPIPSPYVSFMFSSVEHLLNLAIPIPCGQMSQLLDGVQAF
jgi:hypothetical protein